MPECWKGMPVARTTYFSLFFFFSFPLYFFSVIFDHITLRGDFII